MRHVPTDVDALFSETLLPASKEKNKKNNYTVTRGAVICALLTQYFKIYLFTVNNINE